MADFHEDEQPKQFTFGVWLDILRFAIPFKAYGGGLAVAALIIAACEVAMPYFVGRIVDHVKTGANDQLWNLGVSYFSVAVVLSVAILVFILFAGRIASGVSHDIRVASFDKLQQLSFSYFDRRPVGWIMSRLTSDCDRLSRILGWCMLDFVWGLSMVCGIAAVMLYLNWSLALTVLAVVPPLAIISVYFQQKLLVTARQVRKANAEITGSFNESIMGVQTTKSLVREQANLDEFQQPCDRMYEYSVRNMMHTAVYVPMIISLGSVMAGLALWVGGGKVLTGTLSIGTLVTFMAYAALFFEPIYEMARQFTEIQMAQAAAERIQELLNTEPEIQDSAEVRLAIAKHEQDENRSQEIALDGGPENIESIEFQQVGFSYRTGNPVLSSFNLKVRQGETIALVGPTGGGKTTIVNLLCRFYEPTTGSILLNGTDYRRRSSQWLHSNLGIVLQTPHLFSGSVTANIRYGNLAATDEQVEEAARLVHAHFFIRGLKDGYETNVGEGGNRLSTGQKQLVALARAVIAQPQIFIMDEATSSVDTETEVMIQRGIGKVLNHRTSFIIAHRLSTIQTADRILVITGGEITESGQHEELLERRGHYFRLYTHQFVSESTQAAFQEGVGCQPDSA